MNDQEFQENLKEYIVSALEESGDPYTEAVYAGVKAFTRIFFFKTGMRSTKLSDKAMQEVYQLVHSAFQNVEPEIRNIIDSDKGRFNEEDEKK